MINRVFSILGDYAGLYMLHRTKSNLYHFSNQTDGLSGYSDIVLNGIHTSEICWHSDPATNVLNRGRYRFRSVLQSAYPTNDQASGIYYSNPSNKPVHVIMLHGWRISSLNRVSDLFLNAFLERNYQLYFPYLPYHFDRAPDEMAFNGEFLVSANVERTIHGVWQAVADLRALINWLKENREGKIVVIGVSLGGYFTNLLAAFEQGIDLLISVMYANSLAHSVFHTIPGRYIKKDFLHHGFTYEQLRQAWADIEPSNYTPQLALDRILLLSGRYDKYVDLEDSERLHKAWGEPRHIIYDCAHSGLVFYRKRILRDVLDFITY